MFPSLFSHNSYKLEGHTFDVYVMSSALFAYWVREESAEHIPPLWKQYARAAVHYLDKALELLKVEQVSDFFQQKRTRLTMEKIQVVLFWKFPSKNNGTNASRRRVGS